MIKALDLGCGDKPKNIFNADIVYGIDAREDLSKNVICRDLAIEDLPFDSDFFDYVTAHDVIEHIPRVVYLPQRRLPFVELMNEIWRVLKKGGNFYSSTPAYPHMAAFSDPTHVNIITEQTFLAYFDHRYNWAKGYGFRGGFELTNQEWRGEHLVSIMTKI
jgi:SAM-dependent methyltransferase